MRADRLADIDRLLRDTGTPVTAADRDAALTVALERYSRDRPRRLVHRQVPPAEGVALAALPGWTAGLSALVAVEYPTWPETPRTLDTGCWTVADTPGGPVAPIVAGVPAGAAVGLVYTGAHVAGDDSDSVPPGHREAVACYAAAHLLEGLAVAHAGDRDPTLAIQGAGPAPGGVSREYAARARRLRDLYMEAIADSPAQAGPAGASATLVLPASDGGRRLFRRRR